MNLNKSDIDFVVAWVDGNDPEWRKRKEQLQSNESNDSRIERYRDWELLRYWFRGVEKYTPWVRKVHFICNQSVPEWLNVDNPSLNIVKHSDYIPKEYLPTFNSHTIELNSFRIHDLSDNYVYFNDDMFVIKEMKETSFFVNDLPVDCAALNPLPSDALSSKSADKRIFYIPLNDTEYLNREFDFKSTIKKHPTKWFNYKYGSYLIRNLIFSNYSRFIGLYVFHLGQPYNKKAFVDAWEKNLDILDKTCRHHFRDDHDVSQSLIRYRQLASGNFVPGKPIKNAVFHIGKNIDEICSIIKNQSKPMICLNDSDITEDDFNVLKQRLIESFDTILPDKSRFEK